MEPTQAQSLQLSQEDAAKLFNASQWNISFGPLNISISVDLSIPQVSITVTLAGITIGSATLNAQNPTATIGGSVGFAKAEVTFTLNMNPLSLSYDAQVSIFGHGTSKSGTIPL